MYSAPAAERKCMALLVFALAETNQPNALPLPLSRGFTVHFVVVLPAAFHLHQQVALRKFRHPVDAIPPSHRTSRREPHGHEWERHPSRSQRGAGTTQFEMAPPVWRVGLPVREKLDGKGLLGLLRLPRRSDHAYAGHLRPEEFPRQHGDDLSALRVLKLRW